jgi:hypothetical protein
MAYVRCRIFAEPAGATARPTLNEYQETFLLGDGVDIFGAGSAALFGYCAARMDHADLVDSPHALVLVVEPFEPPGDPDAC